MARDGVMKLEHKQITKQIGQLFVDRASINLHSDILDHPDFFWEVCTRCYTCGHTCRYAYRFMSAVAPAVTPTTTLAGRRVALLLITLIP